MNNYAIELINTVDTQWQSMKAEYPHGYAVFYGRVTTNPKLMLVGANPGGTQRGEDWKQQALDQLERDMEYIQYCDDSNYKLAKKTCAIFRENDQLELLRTAVKTNLIFFRSRDLASLNQMQAAAAFCHPLVMKAIQKIRPDVLLCEGMSVLDTVISSLFAGKELELVNEYKRNSRKYYSYRHNDGDAPRMIIGITHLSGSRPSTEDIHTIRNYLKTDLVEA